MTGFLSQNEQSRSLIMNPFPSPQFDSFAIVIIGLHLSAWWFQDRRIRSIAVWNLWLKGRAYRQSKGLSSHHRQHSWCGVRIIISLAFCILLETNAKSTHLFRHRPKQALWKTIIPSFQRNNHSRNIFYPRSLHANSISPYKYMPRNVANVESLWTTTWPHSLSKSVLVETWMMV